jgi:hypothetical protein
MNAHATGQATPIKPTRTKVTRPGSTITGEAAAWPDCLNAATATLSATLSASLFIAAPATKQMAFDARTDSRAGKRSKKGKVVKIAATAKRR